MDKSAVGATVLIHEKNGIFRDKNIVEKNASLDPNKLFIANHIEKRDRGYCNITINLPILI